MEILLDWRRVVDFIVLASTLYVILRWASGARAMRLALAITAMYAGVLFARQLDLVITTWILQGAAILAVVFLAILFQPEIRRALMRLDRLLLTFRRGSTLVKDNLIAESAFEMAAAATGALIVITRKDPVDDLVDGGVILSADVSKELIHTIFVKNSPLHDGAVLIEGGRIARAGAVLPLTLRADVPPEFGTRHRAAMGIAERSDVICIAVSEERRAVTVMRARTFLRVRDVDELSSLIRGPAGPQKAALGARLSDFIFARWRMKLAALAIASLIFTGALFDASSSVRVIEAPIEFQNVPRGLDIADQSATSVEVQLRGRTWLMDSNRLSGLIARFDLGHAQVGRQTVRVDPGALNLPPGISVKRVNPDRVAVVLVNHLPGTAGR